MMFAYTTIENGDTRTQLPPLSYKDSFWGLGEGSYLNTWFEQQGVLNWSGAGYWQESASAATFSWFLTLNTALSEEKML